MARVLVTGASGFIGQQLVAALLARGDDVACLVRTNLQGQALEKFAVRLVRGDVTDPATLPAAITNVDTVYHVAGLTRGSTLAQYCAVNEAGVCHVVEACAHRTSPPVVVVVSSLAAAGAVADAQQPRTESDVPRPVSHYGRSKRAGELAAEALADRVPISIIRPPIVLGSGDRTGLALFRNIRRFRFYMVPNRVQRFSVIHVADLAAALIAAAEGGERLSSDAITPSNSAVDGSNDSAADRNHCGRGYYFVAAEENPTFGHFGRMIGRSVCRPNALALPMPRIGIWSVCAAGEFLGRTTRRAFYLNLDRAREMTGGHWVCSPKKAHRELGFACGASLPQRIEETAQWYREHGWL